MNKRKVVEILERFEQPSTLLWRGIELKLLRKQVDKYIRRDSIVLDLGCGEGLVAKAIFDRKVDIGIDNDREMAKKAVRSGNYRRVLCADAKNMPLGDQSVDIIFSNSVVEHIEKIGMVLSEIRRVLKKGGVVILTVPNSRLTERSVVGTSGFLWLARWYGERRNIKFNHYNLWGEQEWKRQLEVRGLKLLAHYSYLSREETIFWDLLLICFYILNKINRSLSRYVYRVLFKSAVWRIVNEAKVTDDGSSSCLVIRCQPNIRS